MGGVDAALLGFIPIVISGMRVGFIIGLNRLAR